MQTPAQAQFHARETGGDAGPARAGRGTGQAGIEAADWVAGRERLLMEQLPHVKYIARHIHDRLPPHVPLEDLVQAGVVGLIDAFEKYDPGRNVQFSSYAKFRIRGAILDSLRALDWGSRDLRKKERLMEQAGARLAAELGRAPTDTELASEMRLELSDFHRLLGELQGLDLGVLIFPGGENQGKDPFAAHLLNAPGEDPFHLCLQSELKQHLEDAIGELPERERLVLSLYYYEELTMKEVGEVLGVTESRASQIHSAALVRLRGRLRQLRESR